MATKIKFKRSSSGSVNRNVQDRLEEQISVKDFGAVADGDTTATDNTSAFQAAINAALATGVSTIKIPAGTYFFTRASSPLDVGVGGLTFVGDSKTKSILYFDEGVDLSLKHLFSNVVNTVKKNLKFLDIGFKGSFPTRALGVPLGSVFNLSYYSDITVKDCEFNNLGWSVGNFSYLGKFSFIDNTVSTLGGNGIVLNDTPNYEISNNYFYRLGGVTITSLLLAANLGTQLEEKSFITKNICLSTGGILVYGPKNLKISYNILKLPNQFGISVGYNSTTNDGKCALNDVDISNNTITDVVNITSITPAIPLAYISVTGVPPTGAASTNSKAPFEYNSLGVSIVKPWDWSHADGTNVTHAVPPLLGLKISNNICRRTLPNAANYSTYGYGTKIYSGSEYNPAITNTSPNFYSRPISGINISNGTALVNSAIQNNIIEHTSTGISIPAATRDTFHKNVKVNNNIIFDSINQGIFLASSTFNNDIDISGNTIDADYFRINSNSNTTGSYIADGTPHGIEIGACKGLTIVNNIIKNVCRAIVSTNPNLNIIRNNVLHSGVPVAIGFNAGNKGIGVIELGKDKYSYVIEECDPTNSNFGQVSNTLISNSSSMPNSGYYPAGWITWVETPIVVDAGSTDYVVIGWIRLTSGTSHALNTDWVEMRTLTGT